jgi:hypothetical protein
MTDEQIIQKAREAGMTGEATPAVIEFVRNLLEAEIEACAIVCDDINAWNMDDPASTAAEAIRARKSL